MGYGGYRLSAAAAKPQVMWLCDLEDVDIIERASRNDRDAVVTPGHKVCPGFSSLG